MDFGGFVFLIGSGPNVFQRLPGRLAGRVFQVLQNLVHAGEIPGAEVRAITFPLLISMWRVFSVEIPGRWASKSVQ